ncbi:hypothetical protein [Flavobacterium gelatinilyticum]|nr:hypothetical protein [Flavobacterium gelatinilyticum]
MKINSITNHSFRKIGSDQYSLKQLSCFSFSENEKISLSGCVELDTT